MFILHYFIKLKQSHIFKLRKITFENNTYLNSWKKYISFKYSSN